MWLSRARYEQLLHEAATEARAAALLRQHVDWLSAQVNRLEAERALYLQRLVGVNVPVPMIVPVAPQTAPAPAAGAGTPLADTDREPVAGIDMGALQLGAAAFEDMGDEEAARQGIATEVIAAVR